LTTIVWANGKLGSDSLATANGRVTSRNAVKIFFPPEGETWSVMGKRILAYGASGTPSGDAFIQELMASPEGITHRTELYAPSKVSFSVLAIDEHHQAWKIIYDGGTPDGKNKSGLVCWKVSSPSCIGSGGLFADTALAMGFGVKEAIKIAKKMDPSSGGKAVVYKLPPKVEE